MTPGTAHFLGLLCYLGAMVTGAAALGRIIGLAAAVLVLLWLGYSLSHVVAT